jgi:hypothetical protein
MIQENQTVCTTLAKIRCIITIYATLAYIRHFIFAGCYDNDPWYLVTNFAGHLDLARHLDLAGQLELAGFYFSKCPANFLPFHLEMERAQV